MEINDSVKNNLLYKLGENDPDYIAVINIIEDLGKRLEELEQKYNIALELLSTVEKMKVIELVIHWEARGDENGN